MKKLYVLSMVTSLLAGVFIGYHAEHTNNATEQKNNVKEKCSQIAFYDNMIQNTNTIEILYINYERVSGAKAGDKIVTYFIYNPFTKAQDDVLTRMDFIIDEHAI